ncbi:MAG TPA: hypothetical protein VFJ82_23605 [Longimicrobium sp.]|nr:hypothetical protein [Longimicrobium sp.]
MAEQNRPDERELREMAERDRQLAGEAAHDADVERPAAAGAPGHPHPDIAAADHLRARDDVRTFGRQQELAELSADAAETLSASAEQLRANRERIEQIRQEAGARTAEVRDLAGDARGLREQTRQAAEQVRAIEPPDVDV